MTDSMTAPAMIRRSAAAQAEALRAGEISAEELTRAHLDRIAAHDGDVRRPGGRHLRPLVVHGRVVGWGRQKPTVNRP